MIALVLTGVPVTWRTLAGMMRGRFAADIVAMLAIAAAVPLGQPLAGLIVVLMQTGGEALERYAEGRASDAVRALEADAPRLAHRQRDGRVEEILVSEIAVGDILIVRPGEMLPCDGTVLEGTSHVDTSRLTGEALPVHATRGVPLSSGTINGEGSLVLRADHLSSQSLYARIVELVRSAEASKAPIQRLADRFAVWFTPLTLATCAIAWLASGDPLRILAVLVVATPCPLILATPVAIIGGINRAASRQIIMRTGASLERLSAARTAVFDKTGTVTIGRPEVSNVVPLDSMTADQLLLLAGAVELQSSHLLARSLVEAASHLGSPPAASDVREAPGRGVEGMVEGQRVAVGARSWILERLTPEGRVAAQADGSGAALRAYVAVDGKLAGAVEYADRLRDGAAHEVARLRRMGIRRVILLSGDRGANVHAVAEALGIREWHGDLLPDEKEQRVAELSKQAGGVLMVGDGTNDAPALARADVGIALGGHGGGITAEAADVVILNDELSRVSEAIEISRRTMMIASQSIWVGLGLSGVAMLAAAAGYITPVAGALLQEAVDVAVILNALRARRAAPSRESTSDRRA
jgi:heavy metal translocating P-type ATPase